MNDFLRNVPLFADLPDDDLEHLCKHSETVTLAAGETLFSEGDPGDFAYVIEQGLLEVIKDSRGRDVLLAVTEPGAVIGEMALLENMPRMASVRARTDSKLIAISRTEFDHLLEISHAATTALFNVILGRLRSTETMLRQSEKMAQLGTLTAGVAHELNNPAAAVKRGAGQLQGALATFSNAAVILSRLELTAEQQARLDELVEQAEQYAVHPVNLDSLARSDLEYEIETWLGDQQIENAWEVAPALVNLSFSLDELAGLRETYGPQQLPAIIGWLNGIYQIYSLVSEIGQGAGRISEIVKALKSYSYLDQAPMQEINVHEGLDDTLTILKHKLKQGITIHREYAPDLPAIEAYGSELNQVWTNIIDNAIDALDGKGDITIRTYAESDWVVVEIEDNGPGIPPEYQGRIFDAFFTTKPPGKGTGLGLDISYKLVTLKHRGDIRVDSQPGRTVFQVRLPIHDSR